MLIWINGPFGIGKTTTARALRSLALARGGRARIYDPEMLGSFLQRVIPAALRPPDFRDQQAWKIGTKAAVRAASMSKGLVIVPMSISSPDQLSFLTAGCAARSFLLSAPRTVVEARIRSRTFAVEWSLKQLETWRELEGLGALTDATCSPEQVATTILAGLAA